jgi:hypothetical protein
MAIPIDLLSAPYAKIRRPCWSEWRIGGGLYSKFVLLSADTGAAISAPIIALF